jgi:hypothetical protein
LDNLVKTGQFKNHVPTSDEIQRLLRAIRRNLDDARVAGISDEARFDMAYRAIMQCSMIGAVASGYRPSTQMPGHHQTMVQTLSLTMGVPKSVWLVLDVLRKKRNLSDYTGEGTDPESVRECIAQAKSLFAHTMSWLERSHKELVRG